MPSRVDTGAEIEVGDAGSPSPPTETGSAREDVVVALCLLVLALPAYGVVLIVGHPLRNVLDRPTALAWPAAIAAIAAGILVGRRRHPTRTLRVLAVQPVVVLAGLVLALHGTGAPPDTDLSALDLVSPARVAACIAALEVAVFWAVPTRSVHPDGRWSRLVVRSAAALAFLFVVPHGLAGSVTCWDTIPEGALLPLPGEVTAVHHHRGTHGSMQVIADVRGGPGLVDEIVDAYEAHGWRFGPVAGQPALGWTASVASWQLDVEPVRTDAAAVAVSITRYKVGACPL